MLGQRKLARAPLQLVRDARAFSLCFAPTPLFIVGGGCGVVHLLREYGGSVGGAPFFFFGLFACDGVFGEQCRRCLFAYFSCGFVALQLLPYSVANAAVASGV
jgi:hypothetical protein